jgi:1-aminocyclopropane-1-carboxylate deaminase
MEWSPSHARVPSLTSALAPLPEPFSEIPRVKLLFDRPSDIEALSRLTKRLDAGGASFWMKREDCNSGLAFGGNKVRKLEYVLADAIAQGADTLVTTGGIQSNHMRQTAAAASRLGLRVALYPQNAVKEKPAEYDYAGNVQLGSILGAEVFPVGETEESVLAALRARGRVPYSIPPGASTHPLGGLGYARWAFELLEQEKRLGVIFDVVVAAAGSGSTLGGMVAGFKLAQRLGRNNATKRLLGFSIIGDPTGTEMVKLVLDIARTTASAVGLSPDEISEDDFEIDAGFIGEGYGILDQRTAEGVKELARVEGILTDPVYTGKAFTGLLHRARAGQFGGQKVLFCHTGGQVALSAYPQLK